MGTSQTGKSGLGNSLDSAPNRVPSPAANTIARTIDLEGALSTSEAGRAFLDESVDPFAAVRLRRSGGDRLALDGERVAEPARERFAEQPLRLRERARRPGRQLLGQRLRRFVYLGRFHRARGETELDGAFPVEGFIQGGQFERAAPTDHSRQVKGA